MNPEKSCDENLRQQLEHYKTQKDLTLQDLARALASNSTQISRYLDGKPTGDVARLESLIADVLKNAARHEEIKVQIFQTSATEAIAAHCETIRKTNDVGLIHGPAGIGKSCGAQLYQTRNPSSILITTTRYQSNAGAVLNLLFAAIESRAWKRNTPRGTWIASKLDRSNRLILVDNAHRLTPSGFELLFDLHDATDVPIALIGNAEVRDRLRANDQLFSRIGLAQQITSLKSPKTIAAKLIAQYAPGAKDTLDALAQIVLEQQGRCRALKKQLLLARELMDKGDADCPDWPCAFRDAHTKLIRDYPLDT